jgi:tektin-1
VHDDVQKELLKEVEIENGSIALLQRLLEQSKEQLRLSRKAKFDLESDLSDKFNAKSIDEYVRDISLTNNNLYLKTGATKIQPS